jgi:hypothetical protein
MRPCRLFKIRQRFEAQELDDPRAALREQLTRLNALIRPGTRVAIAVGSRGISNLALIVKEVSDFVKGRGARPSIVPAMGSHGGATAEGQREVLRLYGVSEETIGAPVHATMSVVELPQGSLPHRSFMDRHAYESDGVILINRIKPHSDFHGRYESGLMKMALIGLGKLEGALAIHQFGVDGLREMIGPGASQVLASGKILAGIGLVENAVHKTMIVNVLRADEIAEEEPKLLEAATRSMPSLPVDAIDVLVIDRMGKDISGVGMDPNIIGRIGVRGQNDPGSPRIKAIVVSDLTEQSHGNAIGVGLADVITRRLYDKIDPGDTYRNVITSGFLERGKIPIVADSDREAFEIALASCGHMPDRQERVIRVLDTLHLEEMYVSQAIAEELRNSPRIEIAGAGADLFDDSGTLATFSRDL